MTRKLLIIFGLLCLFSVAQAQETELSINADDLFADGVTILDEIDGADIQDTYALFIQNGSWRIQNTGDEVFLCHIVSDDCRLLPAYDELETQLDPCEPYWRKMVLLVNHRMVIGLSLRHVPTIPVKPCTICTPTTLKPMS